MGLINLIFVAFFIPVYSLYTIIRGRNVNEKLLLVLAVISSIGTVHDSPIIWALYLAVVLFVIINGKTKADTYVYLRFYYYFIFWMIFSFICSFDTSFYFGIMMIVKFATPILFFVAAYKTFSTREQILSFYKKLLNYWPVYLFLGLLGVRFQNIDNYFLYFGMVFFFVPYVLYRISGKGLIKYSFIALSLMIPAILFPKRTPIIGCMVGITIVFILKYKLKALLPLLFVSVFPILLVFSVPQLKEKFFFDSSITISDVMNAGIEFENINSNGRSFFWVLAYDKFYKDREIIGSGTGALKTYMRSPQNEYGDSFQLLHNDWLHILCENGLVGVILLLWAMISTITICWKQKRKATDPSALFVFYGLCICFGGIVTHMFFENCINSFAFYFYFVNYAIALKYIKYSQEKC